MKATERGHPVRQRAHHAQPLERSFCDGVFALHAQAGRMSALRSIAISSLPFGGFRAKLRAHKISGRKLADYLKRRIRNQA